MRALTPIGLGIYLIDARIGCKRLTLGPPHGARRATNTINGVSMLYIYQILSAILIGIAVGAIFSQRNTLLLIGSVIAVALAITTMVSGNWVYLAVGVVVYLLVQSRQRDSFNKPSSGKPAT